MEPHQGEHRLHSPTGGAFAEGAVQSRRCGLRPAVRHVHRGVQHRGRRGIVPREERAGLERHGLSGGGNEGTR